MIHFYTHFDQNYRAQAATMIESLLKYASEEIRIGCLWLGPEGSMISDFGYFPYETPWKDNVISVISLKEFSMYVGGLEEAKLSRPWREFCWTLEPVIVFNQLEDIDRADDDLIVYIDADSFFFNDPIQQIRDDMHGVSIGLTPHHFPKGKEDKARTAGRFNFGFGAFKHNIVARDIVRAWFQKSLGVWGPGENDQTYLNDWPSILGNQLIEMHRGFNVGPWQEVEVREYDAETKGSVTTRFGCGIKGTADDRFHNLISYHFHEFRRCYERNPRNPVEVTFGDFWNRTNYPITPTAIEHIYKPYEEALAKWI